MPLSGFVLVAAAVKDSLILVPVDPGEKCHFWELTSSHESANAVSRLTGACSDETQQDPSRGWWRTGADSGHTESPDVDPQD